MKRSAKTFIDQWNHRYFARELGGDLIELLYQLPSTPEGLRHCVEMIGKRMKFARLRGKDLPLEFAKSTVHSLKNLLPGRSREMIPQVTAATRHEKIDAYLENNPWLPFEEKRVFLDLGCGFPPTTTIETAERFPQWQVFGADPGFHRYLLTDKDGSYANINEAGEVKFFQPSADKSEEWYRFRGQREQTKNYFAALFQKLKKELKSSGTTELEAVRKDSVELVRNPLIQFKRDNLTFFNHGIGEVPLEKADVVRAFNVLVYFDMRFRNATLTWVSRILKDGGLFICGLDWIKTTAARYFVFQKKNGQMVPREFAFGLENIRSYDPFIWCSLHDELPESNLLSYFTGKLRAAESFVTPFDRRFDQLCEDCRVAYRDKDGYLKGHPDDPEHSLEMAKVTVSEKVIDEGLVNQAVEVLKRQRLQAWKNSVGHVSLAPPEKSDDILAEIKRV